jgi:1,4-alpha-glucan branching enzyme
MNITRATFFCLFTSLLSFAACKKDCPPDAVVEDPTVLVGYQQYGTPFDSVPETKNIIMYEVNLRAFSSSGDLQGVINRLDQLKALNVNVIWLMPIYPIGQINSVNSPYCVKNYYDVGSEYGTLADLRTLTTEAHNRNMAVVVDWVANHTSWDNPWVSQHSDWYSQDGSGNIIIPPGTNWADVADLNFDNQTMRLNMIDAMKYWILEANIDGFRCDYADGVPYDFWKQAIDTLNTIPNRNLIFLAEGTRADHYAAGFQMTYAWDFYTAIKNVFAGSSPSTIYTTNTAEYAGVPAGNRKLRFTTNHDQSAWEATPMTLFNGKAGATCASVIATYYNGVPLIYTGQEVGRVSTVPFFSNSPINWTVNLDMQQNYRDMLSFYSQSAVSRYGTAVPYTANDVVCFKKVLNADQILVIANVRNTTTSYSVPTALLNSIWTNALTGASVTLGNSLSLSAYQYLILKN